MFREEPSMRELAALVFVASVFLSAEKGSAQIVLDGSNHCSNFALGPITSISCTIPSVRAGDLITVEFADRNGIETSVSDGTNGTYSTIYYVPDSSDPHSSGMAYFANSAAGSLTVTVALPGVDAWGIISVQAWKGAATSSVLDTGAVNQNETSTSGTVANAACGTTAQTPSGSGELVIRSEE